MSKQPIIKLEEFQRTYRNGSLEVHAVRGVTLDILPPEVLDSTGGIEIPSGYIALDFPICLAEGTASISIIIYP